MSDASFGSWQSSSSTPLLFGEHALRSRNFPIASRTDSIRVKPALAFIHEHVQYSQVPLTQNESMHNLLSSAFSGDLTILSILRDGSLRLMRRKPLSQRNDLSHGRFPTPGILSSRQLTSKVRIHEILWAEVLSQLAPATRQGAC